MYFVSYIASEKVDINRQEEEDEEETAPPPAPFKKGSGSKKAKAKFETSELGTKKLTTESDNEASNSSTKKIQMSNFVRRINQQR